MCGTPLVTAPDRRERRVVSVLFADLVGFTSRSESADVEDVEGFLRGYHRLLRGELESHGGTVEKFIGDAVMAVFGAPVAHEDDAERAVRAALAIQDAVSDLRSQGLDVHVRVGVTTGEALVSLGADPQAGEGMASGDVVNTAARVQAAAPVNGVLVDERTYRSTDRVVRYADADPIEAKGKAEPVPVWRALATRSTVPEQARPELRLVGRDDEAAVLLATFERSRREPSTQLITVIGAPGIGKTRLVGELEGHIDVLPGLIRWRRGRSLAYGEGVALWALGEMVKAEAGVLESDSAETAAGKLDEAVAAVIPDQRDREWVVRHVRPLVGLEGGGGVTGQGGQDEAFAGWRRFFEALAEDCPTVLVFEDLHWADEPLLDFILLLVDRAGGIPLLVVCTARPELLERRPAWGGGAINALAINLAPLSSDETARLIAELLDQALLPAATQQALLERAEGNPLYAQEYVRMLRDQGLLVRDGGGWRMIGEPQQLPESVQAIIAARLDTLTDAERMFIQDASVVGRTAWLGALAAIADRPPRVLDDLLHTLERKQLLRRVRHSSVAGEVEFSFAHALTQDVAYHQIPRVDRAGKHERAAGWIEALAGEREDKAELLAHHYVAALDLRRQAGEEDGALVPKVRTALAEAGRQALAVNAYAAAARHLNAALELTAATDPARPGLLLDHARAAQAAGRADEPLLREALDAQVASADWNAAATASLLLGMALVYAGQGAQGDEVLATGFEYATRMGYTPVASSIAARLAYRLSVSGRAAQGIQLTEDVLRQAEAAGDAIGRARLQLWHGDSRINTGDPAGIDDMREAAASLSDLSDPAGATAWVNLADNLVGLGDFRSAAETRSKASRAAIRSSADILDYCRAAEADSAYHSGDWDLAIDLATPPTASADRQVAAYARWTRGRIACARGDAATALDDAGQIVDYATQGMDDELLLCGLALMALAHSAAGSGEEASTAASRLLDRWSEIGGMLTSAHTVAELAPIISQRVAIGTAAALLLEGSRWRIGLTAISDGRYAEAAAVYREMGSQPLEAVASRLASGDRAEATGA